MKKLIVNGLGATEVNLTAEEIAAAQVEDDVYQADMLANSYKHKRQAEYPPIGDQLDAILKELNQQRLDGRNLVQDADNILAKWLAVKAKYPKPL